jgi:phosphoribosylformylglycinamidine synthase PurS subunit
VARYVVDVMPKPEILDPQGKAVLGALPRLGFSGVTDVRQGKRFELEVEGDDQVERVRQMAETLLANPVIEDFTVARLDEPLEPPERVERVEPQDPAVEPGETTDPSISPVEAEPESWAEPVDTRDRNPQG